MNSLESIYYVVSWLCHRRCPHCYDERFRPYQGSDLSAVLAESRSNWERIIDHFPASMLYRVPTEVVAGGNSSEHTGRIILSGGEVLVPQIRESVLYPAIERIVGKYRNVGGVKVVVQTTGDLVTERIVEELLKRGVWMISVSGMDDYHEGFTPERRAQLMSALVTMFEHAGMRRLEPVTHKPTLTPALSHPMGEGARRAGEGCPSGSMVPIGESQIVPAAHERGSSGDGDTGPVFSFFGATEDAWIGKIWPRGRAWRNGLSRATLADNFCNAWSGGLNFLNLGLAGSEVSIEPNGNVYPCCLKTKCPLGNLMEEPLMDILRSLIGHPVFEAISMGHPERMGIRHGWPVSKFLESSQTVTPDGHSYQNLCIGCDNFQAAVLAPVLSELRAHRLAQRGIQQKEA